MALRWPSKASCLGVARFRAWRQFSWMRLDGPFSVVPAGAVAAAAAAIPFVAQEAWVSCKSLDKSVKNEALGSETKSVHARTGIEGTLADRQGLVAAVLGATGAVGQEVVRHLVERDQWSKVVVLNRRHVDYHSSKVEAHILDMSDAEIEGRTELQCKAILMGADVLFNTMGIGAASKVDEASLRNVDVDVPCAVSRGARAAGVKHVSILSAVGADKEADPDAGITLFGMLPKTRAGGNLYNYCKGLVEHNVRSCGFPSVSTFRPAALIGTPNTPSIVAVISPLLDTIVPIAYKSSNIKSVSLAMVKDAEAAMNEGPQARQGELNVFEAEKLHAMYEQ